MLKVVMALCDSMRVRAPSMRARSRKPTLNETKRLLNIGADPQAAVPVADNRRMLQLLLDRGARIGEADMAAVRNDPELSNAVKKARIERMVDAGASRV